MIREATEPEIRTVLGWTHALWGDNRPFEGYVERIAKQMATRWGRTGYHFAVGLVGGQPVTACKRYRLRFGGVPTVGFGAVFTPEEHRGKGHAAELISGVMAQERAPYALLYSDIDPLYYIRLGFQPYPAYWVTATAEAGPVPFRPLAPYERAEALAIQLPGEFRPDRSPDYWDYLHERSPVELYAFVPDGTIRGWVAFEQEEDQLWLAAAGYDAEPEQFWQGLRALTAQHGVPKINGWGPRVAADHGYAYEVVKSPVPMIAGENLPKAVTWWGLDHF
ncbi:MAG: hypothetical protein JWM80_383 [Cyanobacteria bacterium RYN_339]|nr:hypothetical protein [Cyanobacteria bacterium RYN_339]